VYRANRNEPELTAVICDSNEIYGEDWTSGGATLLSVMISSGQRAVAHLVCAVLTPWCGLCRRVCTTQGKASTWEAEVLIMRQGLAQFSSTAPVRDGIEPACQLDW